MPLACLNLKATTQLSSHKQHNMKLKRFSIFLTGLLASITVASAQSYYDDDIYYNASKATKKEASQQ